MTIDELFLKMINAVPSSCNSKLSENRLASLHDKFTLLDEFAIKIPEKKLLRRLGYKTGADSQNSSINEMIATEQNRFPSLIKPQAVYVILDYQETNQHPIFEQANKVALCLCTIGPELEKTSSELIQQNEMLKGFILDSLGSEAAEEVAVQSDKVIAAQALESGLWPSKRYSPGYGTWDIREQKYIFDVLPADSIGVSLSQSFMMSPRKSVSFRINFYAKKELSTRRF